MDMTSYAEVGVGKISDLERLLPKLESAAISDVKFEIMVMKSEPAWIFLFWN